MSFRLQEIIHKVEQGPVYRYLAYVAGIIFFATVAVCYDVALYRNLSTIEGMDAAQLARNLAVGKGYTTDFIRPFSIFLLRRHLGETNALPELHPDLANPPVYPALLAGALKVMPFAYEITAGIDNFRIHLPDLWITGLNQFLFLGALALVFVIARRLFDPSVAWVSAGVVLGTELLWRFTNSGLPTLLLIVLFLGLLWALVRIEFSGREQTEPRERQVLLLGDRAHAWTGHADALQLRMVDHSRDCLPGLQPCKESCGRGGHRGAGGGSDRRALAVAQLRRERYVVWNRRVRPVPAKFLIPGLRTRTQPAPGFQLDPF
jgi:hypothetical protein